MPGWDGQLEVPNHAAERSDTGSDRTSDRTQTETATSTDVSRVNADERPELFERTHRKINEKFFGQSADARLVDTPAVPERESLSPQEKEFRKNTGLSTLEAEFNRSRVVEGGKGFIDLNTPLDLTNPIKEDRGFRTRWGQTSFATPAESYSRALAERQSKGFGEPRFSRSKPESWLDVALLADRQGFRVTSARGGEHNRGSTHGKSAVDVSIRGISPTRQDQFLQDARSMGVSVRDERTRPAHQPVWGGAHFHLDYATPRRVDSYWGYGTRAPNGGD